MLSWIKAGWSIAGFPIRAAWKGYSALWWAFEDDAPRTLAASTNRGSPTPELQPGATAPASAMTPTPAVKPGQRPTKPVKALKRGFVATLATSTLGAWAMAMAHHEGNLSDPRAVLGGLWIAGTACVVSLLLVRRSERLRIARESAPTPLNSVKRGLRHAVATMRERGAAFAFLTRAMAARAAATAGLDRLVR